MYELYWTVQFVQLEDVSLSPRKQNGRNSFDCRLVAARLQRGGRWEKVVGGPGGWIFAIDLYCRADVLIAPFGSKR